MSSTTSTSSLLIDHYNQSEKITAPELIGHILAANPLNPQDELDHGVVLIVSHDRGRAVGIQLNNAMKETTIGHVAENIGMDTSMSPDDVINQFLYHGGRLNHGRINIVHSDDWASPSSSRISDGIFLTSDISVLSAIASGEGPRYFRACAGFCVWENYALERELDTHLYPNEIRKWETVASTPELVFDYDGLGQWKQAMLLSASDSADRCFGDYF
jgi:putative transcriptional regulator